MQLIKKVTLKYSFMENENYIININKNTYQNQNIS